MRILQSILLVLLLVPTWTGPKRLDLLGRDARIDVKRVRLDADDPARRRVGQLTWLGGVQLSSPDPTFGGFSSMRVQGDRFTLLSDGGNIVSFALDRYGRLSDPHFAELPDGPGNGWQKRDRDSESLVVDPASGDVWVGFERANAIWRYDSSLTRVRGHAAPPVMARWDENGGPETMVRMPDGGMIVIAETTKWRHRAARKAVRFAGDPVAHPNQGFQFGYLPPAGYDPSDATLLPDGRLLILNRRFALPFKFSAKLTIVDPAQIRPRAVVRGREIATLAAPLIHDNFEGIVATREGRDTIVWIVSDDNQLVLERTLLLKFRLEPGG
ncbi:esterase-like activity of phytase family protein [Sphingomonas alpina]|uniref:Esterase-like activity of phytase family protein n=1 Tax=Sphingomonas alpina TaxID=653931 RepID=A0A7H0LIA8_9SPHN|nr:esterase-like activity of phytase family protein [Sphingomonas alpina]QNQ09411.1 esterase-like activity of phytase family protein [Sphingomonas alpina]